MSMTTLEYAKTWEETVLPLRKPATVVTMKSHLRKLVPIWDLPSAEVQRFFTGQAKTLAPKTVRNLFSTWHLLMTAALREGVILKIPAVVLPRSLRSEQDWLTLQEMRALVAVTGHLRPLYSLLAETGLRIGEVLGLQTQDIVQKSLTVKRSLYNGQVQEPKTTAAKRTISISSRLLATLSPNLESHPKDFLFRSSKSTPLWPDKLGRQMHQDMKDLRIKPMGFHSWRRGCATLCVSLGIPLKVISFRLGHEAQGLTLGRYAQSYTGMDSEWPEKIADQLFRK